jgi:pimeloyl-ACP methyl ester carboxylesterase
MVVKDEAWKVGNGWRARWAQVSLWAACALVGACGSDRDDPAGAGEPDPRDEFGFGSCPRDLPGSTAGRRCAVNKVPLRWDAPEAEKIDVLVARYLSTTPHRGQLWLLDGGPGGTGGIYMLKEILALYTSLGLDVYVPQHRGTGHSTPLTCEDNEEIGPCGDELLATWGDGLRGFHSTEAARDVGNLIERFRTPDEPVFVFGLSYGSYWAQRYLQAFPAQAKGVILEGVLPLGEALWDGDVLADAAARSLFQVCRDEPDCAAAFGDEDPEDAAHRVLAESEDPDRRCLGAQGAARQDVEAVLSLFVAGDLGQFVPGPLRRLARCSPDDQAEILAFVEFVIGALSVETDVAMDNQVLGWHVLRTDLMASVTTFPLEERLAAREPLVFWSGAAPTETFDAIVGGWPVNYPPEPTEQSGLATPLLLLNGGLDIQTPSPWARKLAKTLGVPLVEFPFAGHAVDVSLASPLGAGSASCSLGIIRSFIDDPNGEPDASCAPNAYVPDVAGLRDISRQAAAQLYGHPTPVLGADPARPSPKRLRSAEQSDGDALARTLREQLARALRARRPL